MLFRFKRTDFSTFIPLATAIFCIASIVLCIGINLENNQATWEIYGKWGAPSPSDTVNGKFWGLITSNFLHIEIWHIFFNLYWFWLFGKLIEFTEGMVFLVVLVLSAALVSSLSEYSFAEASGIGLSGVVYAMFGYLWIKGRTDDRYRDSLEQRTIYLFIIWLFVCIILTWTDTLNVGNAAHFGGLAWGMLFAFMAQYGKWPQFFSWLGLVSLLTILIYRSVFSTAYLSQKAYTLHLQSKFTEATQVYKQILKRDPVNEFALGNLRILEIDSLQKKAFELMQERRYDESRALYLQLLRIDPKNSDAQHYMNFLPLDSSVLEKN